MIGTLLLAATLALPPQKADATIGVVAIDLDSGREVSVRGDERFPMGSVYKFPIALAVLHLVDTGKFSMEQKLTIGPKEFSPGWSPIRDGAKGKAVTLTLKELLRSMVSLSDNSASDALLRLIGGPRVVDARLAELGFGGIDVSRQEREMAHDLGQPRGVERYAADARDTATPLEMAHLLVAFWQGRDGLSRPSHALLARWMKETKTGPRRIKAAMAPGSTILHKTGTMPGTVNDAAIVTSPDGKHHVVLVVFSKRGSAPEPAREDDVAAAARAAYDAVTHAPRP
jgi:beta-lactamase class A